MSSLSVQIVTNKNKLSENLVMMIESLSKICLAFIIFYVGTFKVQNSSKTGLLARLKKFKVRAELINKYPGLRMYPLLGSIPEMPLYMIRNPCRDLFPMMQHMVQKFGPIFRAWIFNQPKLVIACPDTAITCLKEENFPARTSEALEVARKIGGDGLLVIAPDVHGPRRKIWNQWFTRRIITGNLEMFQKEAIRLSELLSKETNKTFGFVDYALHCTFRTIACSAFGEEFVNCIPEATAKQHFHGVTTLSFNLFNRSLRPWLSNDFVYYKLTADGRKSMRCIKSAHQLTYDAIKHGKTLRANKTSQCSSTPSFLDHLLDIHERGDLTENQIFNELNTFLVSGYDTTGLSLSWTLYLLALYPEHQSKIVDELSEIFNGHIKDFSCQVTISHLQNMKYLELCIKESLRLYPSLAMLFRRSATEKVAVMPDGNIMPAGVDTYFPLRIIHQDPKYFPDPEKFTPERHLMSIPAYLPFGQGSRNCVGQVYAMQELKMLLAYLLMEYKWETLEKPNLEPLMVPVCYPENGLRFSISKRNIV